MKNKFFIVSVAVLSMFALTGCREETTPVDTQQTTPITQTTGQTTLGPTMTGITMRNGKMMIQMEGGEPIAMDNDIVLPNSTIITTESQVLLDDGTTYIMQEGDVITKSGILTTKGPQNPPSSAASKESTKVATETDNIQVTLPNTNNN